MAFDPLLSAASPLWAMTNMIARKVLSGRARRLPKPVISVGNIVAGGIGKTEVTAAIANRLVAEGKRVVVVSRGYGSNWSQHGGVAHDAGSATALRFPDESIVVLKKVPGVSVAVGADRFAVLTRHWEELNPDVILLDDGYQHFKLKREADILVHDFSIRWPILREFPKALQSATARISLSDLPPYWQRLSTRFPWVHARYVLTGMVDSFERVHRLPPQALVFCALGNPSRFQQSLSRAGVMVGGFRTYPDHHNYTELDVRKLLAWQRASQKEGISLPLLTSLKDFVKLGPFIESQGGIAGFEPCWVQLKLNFLEGENILWKSVNEALAVRPT